MNVYVYIARSQITIYFPERGRGKHALSLPISQINGFLRVHIRASTVVFNVEDLKVFERGICKKNHENVCP
jgi:hypothetical protein